MNHQRAMEAAPKKTGFGARGNRLQSRASRTFPALCAMCDVSLRGAQRRSNPAALRLASPGWRHIEDEIASLRSQ
jgi:hypothetical protein